jgi:hypothetical protein
VREASKRSVTNAAVAPVVAAPSGAADACNRERAEHERDCDEDDAEHRQHERDP